MVLEYLAGGTLRTRLNRLPRVAPKEAAVLLGAVARGVAAAHSMRIVHRDLKPENILFGGDDGSQALTPRGTDDTGSPDHPTLTFPEVTPRVPKVADFGLAKRAASDLTQTQVVMGTPAYMAPEQADGRTKYVGPAADVWALGVILYECVHGERPFDGPSQHELLAAVRRAEVPPLAPTSEMPQEIDLIYRKCLEKVPADRYPTAAELADDLERFARGDPVSVRPLGTAARGVRWVKRNPVVAGLLATLTVVALGLVGSLYAQYRQAIDRARFEHDANLSLQKLAADKDALAREEADRRREAERQQRRADEEAARANRVSGFMTDLFRGSDPIDLFGEGLMPQNWEKQRLKTADMLLGDAAVRFQTELKDQPLARAKFMSAVANSLTSLGNYGTAERLLKDALDARRALLPPDHPDLITGHLDLGRLYWHLGNFPAALEHFRDALAKQRVTRASEADVLTTRFYEALTLTFTDARQAEAIFKEVIAGRERLFNAGDYNTLAAYFGYAAMLLDQGRVTDLLPVLPHILEPLKAHPNPQFRNFGEIIAAFQQGVALAQTATSAGPLTDHLRGQAEKQLRAAVRLGEAHLPVDHWIVALCRFELAGVLADAGNDKEADALFDRIVRDIRTTYGFAHPKVITAVAVIGNRWARANRLADARGLWEEVARANGDRFGPENHWRCQLLLGRCQFEAQYGNDLAAAQRYAAEALALVRAGRVTPTRHVSTAMLRAGEWLARPHLPAAGHPVVRELFATTRQYVLTLYGEQSPEMCATAIVEGERLYALGARAEGLARLERAEALAKNLTREFEQNRCNLLAALGEAAHDRGRFAESETYYAKAVATSRGLGPNGGRGSDATALAGALVGQDKYTEAARALGDARRWKIADNAGERDVAWTDLLLAATRLAGGDSDRYAETLSAMFRRNAKSTDTDTLSRMAWAIGLSPGADPAVAAKLAERHAAALEGSPKFAWGYWGLALARLRAGDLSGADTALKKGGPAWKGRDWSLPALVHGLCAAKRGERDKAREHLARAERLIEGERPSGARPFAYADTVWGDRLVARLLVTELRTAVGVDVAPPPRERPAP